MVKDPCLLCETMSAASRTRRRRRPWKPPGRPTAPYTVAAVGRVCAMLIFGNAAYQLAGFRNRTETWGLSGNDKRKASIRALALMRLIIASKTHPGKAWEQRPLWGVLSSLGLIMAYWGRKLVRVQTLWIPCSLNSVSKKSIQCFMSQNHRQPKLFLFLFCIWCARERVHPSSVDIMLWYG